MFCCINSAANFIIYYLNGTKFRQAWCEIYGYVPRFILSVLCMNQCMVFRNDNPCNTSMYFKAHWSKLIVQAKKIASGASLNIKLQKKDSEQAATNFDKLLYGKLQI